MSFIEMDHIRKSFGSLEVLKDVTLHVETGEVISIIGPSGSGKSTFLRCLCQLETINSGSIVVDGQTMVSTPEGSSCAVYAPAADVRTICRRMGMCFQHFNLFPHMTVLDNILEAPRIVKKMKTEEIMPKAEELLKKVGLWDKRDAYPSRLSGGQQQRVAIARALVLRPAVLLLDEPFSALDAKIRGQMREELKRIQREAGLTVIFVTHDQEEAMAISDRIAVMNQGAIEQLDSPTEIYDNPHSRFVAGFIGEMNFLDEGGAVLAVRPEDIALRSASGAGMARIESVMPLGHYTQIILVRADGARLKVFIPKEQALGYIPGQTADYSFTRFKQFGAAQASA